MSNLHNPIENTGYMPLKKHIALIVISKIILRSKRIKKI